MHISRSRSKSRTKSRSKRLYKSLRASPSKTVHMRGGLKGRLSGGRRKKRDPYARIKNAGVGYLVGRTLGGNNGGLIGAALGGIGNVGFFKGGKARQLS